MPRIPETEAGIEPADSRLWPLLALGLITACVGTLLVSRRKTAIARQLTIAINDWENEGGSVATKASVAIRNPNADGHDPSPSS